MVLTLHPYLLNSIEFSEQDEGLESLLKIVTAQSKIARSINDEVEHHNGNIFCSLICLFKI